MADFRFLNYLRENKWRLRLFTVSVGLLFGFLVYLINPNPPMGILQYYSFSSLVMMYLLYVFLAGHAKKIDSIISKSFKKIVSYRVFQIWYFVFFVWLLIGSLIILYLHYSAFGPIWLFSIIGLFIVYPCIFSVSVYIPSFYYLRFSTDDGIKKKTIVDSLFVATIGLATPWILTLFFISAFFSIPFWANYVIVFSSYLVIFFLAIYLPYYQSMEEVKKKIIVGLTTQRQSLVEKLVGKEITEKVAIELEIQRVDRDVEVAKSESSHPYLFLKPIVGFVIVSILANLLVEIMKVGLHIG